MELKQNQTIRLTNGESAVVLRELGSGGQGIVYEVKVNGKSMALKWFKQSFLNYFKSKNTLDSYYDHLQMLINQKAPSEIFIWPEFLTHRDGDNFGYVMKIRPGGYEDLSKFLLGKVAFKSLDIMVTAALKVCDAYNQLHKNGYNYLDCNDGNFMINPNNGDVLVVDNDNVAAAGQNLTGIQGKQGYEAPEVVLGCKPDKYSDRFSISVILFLLFFMDRPFEGKKTRVPCMTDKKYKDLFGENPVFIMDPSDDSNRPVSGIHNNVIRRWNVFPAKLKEFFIEQFSKECLKDKTKRRTVDECFREMEKLRDSITICPHCGEHNIIDSRQSHYGENKCIGCGTSLSAEHYLKIDSRNIVLTKGKKIFIDRDCTPDGEVYIAKDKDNKETLWIRNISPVKWKATTPSGRQKTVEPNGSMPVKEGITVDFNIRNQIFKGKII